MNDDYDAIIVGARAAGSATAMLLARRGHRVLAVDRAAYATDVRSTHALMKGGVLQLRRWGVLDRVVDAGTPAIDHTALRTGDALLTIPVKADTGPMYAPRRTVLDPVLADAAADAGAEIRFRTRVTGIVSDDSGRVVGIEGRESNGPRFAARAPITIGADGVSSLVARWVGAPPYHVARHKGAVVYTYVDDPGAGGYEWFWRPGVSAGIIPTNGGSLVWTGVPPARFAAEVRDDPARAFEHLLATAAPEAYERVVRATRTSRFYLHAGERGFYRQSYGPGWVLVGDAGHFTDPLSAHGLTDAFRDAELVANAVSDVVDGKMPERDAGAAFEAERDRLSMPIFETVDKIASYEWTTAEVQAHLRDLSHAMRVEFDAMAALDDVRTAA